jgi:hypothetical protein
MLCSDGGVVRGSGDAVQWQNIFSLCGAFSLTVAARYCTIAAGYLLLFRCAVAAVCCVVTGLRMRSYINGCGVRDDAVELRTGCDSYSATFNTGADVVKMNQKTVN